MVLPNFEENLQKYAKLLVSKGINVQKGHTIVINIDVEQAPFARLLTKEAYALGAEEVIVKWTDDIVTRETYLHTSEERMTDIPQYKVDESLDMIEKKASRLSVRSADPDALNGVDGKKLAAVQKANNVAFDAQRIATQANKVSWTVAAAAGAKWAAKVFPDLATEEEQVDALWNEIFKTCRVYEADPVAAWDAHEARLLSKADVLNAEQFDTLHYTASNGTDLIVGMPENHIWESAGSVNAQNEKFIANMPTEEVFSAPDFRRIDGIVKSTKPLSYAGNIIDGMTFRFENGQVTEVTAEKGEETIRRLVEENDGGRSLGEVALVPDPSPISQSGIVFFNTLFDENASNHLALGSAYASSIKGGTEMTQEQLAAAGLNRSTTHVDFMIGSADMNIDGIRKDGSVMPIFRNGDWAF
ncbi:aminopeptidase [Trichococcus pasteurii]|uniref:Peptidase m29 aminopeptidase ii n=1 Tax=Trichococcus pasteurii TaxID=43064 RepID=A0A1W1IK77_9LACT|nr:aminopeptidase [Trichococcus pasteurii]SFF03301.1 Leucyl aminopeptidase (aminopeptidase T) [Trichococcus pasteurii]SLM53219.1 peptidase m29 aminopeptidase ii [Trichococcus pasteurii]SSB94100.1 peptidase m29 aminopeptidase ii [Trichococcus pasteurii]